MGRQQRVARPTAGFSISVIVAHTDCGDERLLRAVDVPVLAHPL